MGEFDSLAKLYDDLARQINEQREKIERLRQMEPYKFCEWWNDGGEVGDTACGHQYIRVWACVFTFCPFCGRRIQLREVGQ